MTLARLFVTGARMVLFLGVSVPGETSTREQAEHPQRWPARSKTSKAAQVGLLVACHMS